MVVGCVTYDKVRYYDAMFTREQNGSVGWKVAGSDMNLHLGAPHSGEEHITILG